MQLSCLIIKKIGGFIYLFIYFLNISMVGKLKIDANKLKRVISMVFNQLF